MPKWGFSKLSSFLGTIPRFLSEPKRGHGSYNLPDLRKASFIGFLKEHMWTVTLGFPKLKELAKMPRNTLFRCGGCALMLSSRISDSMRAKHLARIWLRAFHGGSAKLELPFWGHLHVILRGLDYFGRGAPILSPASRRSYQVVVRTTSITVALRDFPSVRFSFYRGLFKGVV